MQIATQSNNKKRTVFNRPFFLYANLLDLAHFGIGNFIHIAIVEVFACHTPNKHVVAGTGSSVD